MPILTDEQLHRLREIVRKHHLAAIARVAGIDALSPDEQLLIASMGVEMGSDIIEDAYLFGQLTTLLEQAEAEALSYSEFKAKIAEDPVAFTPGEYERRAIDFAKRKAAQYIRNLGQRVEHDVTHEVFDAEERVRREEAVQEEVAHAIEHRETAAALGAKLRRRTEDYARDWERIAVTEVHNAKEHGYVDSIRKRHGADARVFKQVMPDACRWCRQLHIGPDGAPRIFRVKDLDLTNVGRQRDAWQAVVGATHPHCQCATIHIPPGWGFDEDGKLTLGGIYGVEYGSEEAAEKAARGDVALAKAAKFDYALDFQGLPVRIETRPGERRWPDGPELPCAYGFIAGVTAADGEEYDCFVGPDSTAAFVYVVHQKGEGKLYDEDKALLGFSHPEHAKAAYFQSYPEPEKLFGSMSMLTLEDFKAKLQGLEPDGMVKAQTGPRLLLKAASAASNGGAQWHAAGSAAGNRNVQSGSGGPNILFQTPAPPHSGTDPAPRRKEMAEWVATSAKDGQKQRGRFKASVKKLREEAAKYQGQPVRPYEHWKEREEADEAARAPAAKRKAAVKEKLEERNRSSKTSPYRLTAEEAAPHIRLLDEDDPSRYASSEVGKEPT